MSDSLYPEYIELVRGAREHLLSQYQQKNHISTTKENWEALRRVLMAAPRTIPQPQNPEPLKKHPAPPLPPPPVPRPAPPPPPRTILTPQSPQKSQLPGNPDAKRIVEDKVTRNLHLLERPPQAPVDFSSWKEIFQNQFPQIKLSEPEPESSVRTTTFAIVYEKATPQELAFLQNIARTCHLLIGPARVISYEQFKPSAKQPAASYGVHLDNALNIEPLSVYLQSPRLKAQLWRQLYTHFTQKSS